MKFIKLTTTRGKRFWFNMAHARTLYWDIEEKITKISFPAGEDKSLKVKETPAQILEMLRE